MCVTGNSREDEIMSVDIVRKSATLYELI